ncbi:MAG: FMN-binding protein, partial [Bacteroidales bacterium]|nr:FMN-binding protein [Bacteroidales bacterium]
MKHILLAVALVVLVFPAFSAEPDTLTIDTSPFSEEIIGFNGPTPVEIDVVKGRISEIRILPNSETPSFIRRIKESGFLSRLNGKTLQEARDTKLDAVSGAT